MGWRHGAVLWGLGVDEAAIGGGGGRMIDRAGRSWVCAAEAEMTHADLRVLLPNVQ